MKTTHTSKPFPIPSEDELRAFNAEQRAWLECDPEQYWQYNTLPPLTDEAITVLYSLVKGSERKPREPWRYRFWYHIEKWRLAVSEWWLGSHGYVYFK